MKNSLLIIQDYRNKQKQITYLHHFDYIFFFFFEINSIKSSRLFCVRPDFFKASCLEYSSILRFLLEELDNNCLLFLIALRE